MQEILLVKYGEIILKGLNRPVFEAVLVKNIRRTLSCFPGLKIYAAQATIYIEPAEEIKVNTKMFVRSKKKVSATQVYNESEEAKLINDMFRRFSEKPQSTAPS